MTMETFINLIKAFYPFTIQGQSLYASQKHITTSQDFEDPVKNAYYLQAQLFFLIYLTPGHICLFFYVTMSS